MEKRKFGKTDMEVSVLGFGGAEIGFNPRQTQTEVDELLNSANCAEKPLEPKSQIGTCKPPPGTACTR